MTVIPELLIKRCFPALLGGMIMTAAYHQALGISFLVKEAWTTDLPRSRPPRAPPPPADDRGAHATSAAAILARNPFDSVTGPLTPRPAGEGEADDVVTYGDPLLDPICDGARVLLIAASEDPSWSFATIAVGRGEPLLRRAGDPVEGRSVLAIGWDRVWLTEPGARCQVRIGDNRLAPARAKAPSPSPAPKKPRRGALPPEIASKIRQVSDREFVVDRSAIELVLEKQGELMRSARIVPAREGERVIGVRLSRVTPGSLLTAIGLRTGDTIRSINGFDMTDPQSALQAYARLRTADNLAIAVQRGGGDMTIDVRIQ
ncbi:type II secretion system protein GspC [Sorangium sp. So ce119]|uniref:type II secretion system protein GspC n=1 Tax=Sorangium sp. So ce119 TaxID=3133279 RepID=UPI003F6426F2